MRNYTLELPITLNEAEIAERGRTLALVALQAAKLEGEIDDVKRRTKVQVDALKDDVTHHRLRIKALARAVRKGVEVGTVEVRAVVAEDNSKVEIVRTDTGEIVEMRPLTDEDRQMQIEEVLDRVEEETKRMEREHQEDEDDLEEPEEEAEDAEPGKDSEPPEDEESGAADQIGS
ncbi:MAG: hypothetical protein GY769_07965 [bacterium]|nr:hypothetical protein [bacterium]